MTLSFTSLGFADSTGKDAIDQAIAAPASAREFWNCVCIRITQGQHTIIDLADYELVKSKSICASRHPGDYYHAIVSLLNRKCISLHRLLLNAKKGEVVDHVNHDPLDNRRCNLRLCTPTQNAQNSRRRNRSRNSYKSVFPVSNSTSGKWGARIQANGKMYSLGSFWTEEDAAAAYNAAASRLHGEFACQNELPRGYSLGGQAHRLRGEQHRKAVLREEDVLEAKLLRLEGLSWVSLGARYGVATSTIRQAATGKSWSYLSSASNKPAEGASEV